MSKGSRGVRCLRDLLAVRKATVSSFICFMFYFCVWLVLSDIVITSWGTGGGGEGGGGRGGGRRGEGVVRLAALLFIVLLRTCMYYPA